MKLAIGCGIIDIQRVRTRYDFMENYSSNLLIGIAIFECVCYNMNIQINEAENYYTIKFRYLNDLVDYIRLKEGNSFLLNLKSINKDVKHKKRVFNKGNAEIIKEIDNFYSDKQMAKSK